MNEPSSLVQMKICTESSSPNTIVARMVALDGLPMAVFITSKDQRRRLFQRDGHDLPMSAVTIKKMPMDYAATVRRDYNQQLSELINSEKRVSLTLDEWTSRTSRRFMNVFVHCESQVWGLGLKRVSVVTLHISVYFFWNLD